MKIEYPEWYNRIEEPVRDLVYHLRNNGVNTLSSCGHTMEIQAEWHPMYSLYHLHSLLFNYFYEHKMPPTFSISLYYEVENSHWWTPFITISLRPNRFDARPDWDYILQADEIAYNRQLQTHPAPSEAVWMKE